MATMLIKGGTVVSATGRSRGRRARRRREDRRRPRAGLDAARHRPERRRRPGDRRDRQVRHPRRHRRAHPHGAALRRHQRHRHLRDRHPRRGLGRHHHDHRLRRADAPASGSRTGSRPGTRRRAGNCAIDYGFHQIIGGVDEQSLKAMETLVDEGITSYKLFMAYPGVFYSDDAQILRAMQKAAELGPADDDARRERPGHRRARRAALRRRARPTPYFHGVARAWQMEEEATHRAIMLADLTGRPLYVVHVSAKQAVAQLAAARDRGKNVFGETCPQYLYLSLEEQLGATQRPTWGDFEGAKWVCSTPLRSRAEGHQDAHVAGPAHQRPADGLHRPLPVLHEGPEGARPRRLPGDPQRHRLDRAPDGPDVPGRGHRRDHPRALGRADLDHAGADVRPLRHQGRHRTRAPTPTSSSTTRTGTPRSASARARRTT